MKKMMMKLSKFLMLIAVIFSYVSSPIAVLANEIASPLVVTLKAVLEDGVVNNYELTYISEDPNDYEDGKNYTIELVTTVTYTNGDEEVLSEEEISVDGTTLNSTRSSHTIVSPVLEYYNGEYVLELTIYDGETEMYSNEYTYENDYEALSGLTGKLNGESETLEEVTSGNYNVTTEGKYTQSLNVLTGELSPMGMYRIVYGEGEETTYSDVMTGEVLRTTSLTGTEIDLTGKLAGTYSYTDSVTIEEVTGNETDGYEVVNTYTYSYDATLNYGTDNDDLLSEIYADMYYVSFYDGYLFVPADGFIGIQDEIVTIEELEAKLEGTDITLSVTNGEEEVLTGEVKNDYVLNFTNGATASYVVVVVGDADYDNDFDSDDLTAVMETYLAGEKMVSMDMVTLEVETENEEETVYEEVGTITYEDIAFTNELLKGEDADTNEREIGSATVVFGELPELVYVGDSFEVQVLVSTEVLEEVIDGIDGLVSCTGLKLDDVSYVEFNTLFNGVSNSEGRLVAVASEGLTNEMVVMTLTFTAVEEGTATIDFAGKVYNFIDSNEFELTGEVEVERNISANNNLSSLTPSVGSFDVEFDKDVTVYTLTVPHGTEKVILSGALEDIYSTVDGLIEYELTEDKTTAIITVTAEDGTTKVYTVYIVKESVPVTTPVVYYYSSNNYLKSLEVEGYEIEFDKDTYEYKITVKNDVTSLDISALAEDSSARVEITGNGDFKEGENTVTITVTAENGSTREYKLVVNREEAKQAVTTTDDSSNTAEKVVIIILIILVVLGLLYLIFKKDDEEVEEVKAPTKKEDPRNSKNTNNSNNNKNKKK